MDRTKTLAAFILLVSLSCAAAWKCSLVEGKRLKLTSGADVRVSLPCKFHAVHAQRCGDYRILVTPGLQHTGVGRQFMSTLFISIAKATDQSQDRWSGHMSVKTVGAYLDNLRTHPYQTLFKSHDFVIQEVGNFSKDTENPPGIIFTADDFTIRFGQYGSDQETTSGFEFECTASSSRSSPKDITGSLCADDEGSKAYDARKLYLGGLIGKEDEFTRRHVLAYEALNFEKTAQPQYKDMDYLEDGEGAAVNSTCKKLENVFIKKCANDTIRAKAMFECFNFFDTLSLRKALIRSVDTPSPTDLFWYCTAFYCSDFEKEPWCPHLKLSMDAVGSDDFSPDLVANIERVCPDPIETELCADK